MENIRVIVLPPPSRNYLCYVGVFLLATTLPVEATRVSLHETKRERERETPLIRRRRRMRFNIGWPVRGRGQLGKGSWSRWDTRTYDPRPLLVPLTNVSWHPPGTALLLEGRRHPLTRDSAVSVTRGREPNLIPSHPCSRRPWRPFNYWRDRARVS